MNMKQKTMKGRFLVLTLLVLLAATTLCSCFGGSKAKTKLTMAQTVSAADGGNMTADQLKTVGDMLVSVYDDTAFDVRDWLIAALRGYDMTAEGFDDSKVDPAQKGTEDPVTSALNVLRKANEKAEPAAKISEENFSQMNEADLQRLVDIFKTEVDLKNSGGVWDTILCWIGKFLNWITRYLGFGSYIVGICVFALLVEILMFPFSIKQQKNAIRQAKLRPKEMAIRNKYKGRNDQVTQRKVQEEIQELYQRENFNQFSGCLPLLLQFPIIIALYNVVINPLHYVLGQGAGVSSALSAFSTAARAAGGLGEAAQSSTIGLLSGGVERFAGIADFQYFSNGAGVWNELVNMGKVPNFTIFGKNFGVAPNFASFDILLLVPVLTFAVYYLSMRLNRKFTYQPMQDGANDRQVACSNTMMDVTMPMMSTFFTFMVPAIIGVYWMFRSVVGILKQFIMSKIMPLPKFTEADYKAAAREMAGKAPKVTKSERAGKVRSLHHIDDEDYDDTRERALAQKAEMEEEKRLEQAEKAKKSIFGAPELKADKKDKKNDGELGGTDEAGESGNETTEQKDDRE